MFKLLLKYNELKIMPVDNYEPLLTRKTYRFAFSCVFVLILLLSVSFFPLITFLFHLVFFPFSLLHELGHFCLTSLLLPSLSPQIEFDIINSQITCCCNTRHGYPCCWSSIFSILAGSGSIILGVIGTNYILSRRLSKTNYNYLRKLLFFGLLADLPNLFPILPSDLGSFTDGYIVYTFFSQMNILPPLPLTFSLLFSLFSMILVLLSIYILGSFFYDIGIVFYTKYLKIETLPIATQ